MQAAQTRLHEKKTVSDEEITWLQRPFRCRDHTRVWPGLDGVIFEMYQSMEHTESLCIWAGATGLCTFNALKDFIRERDDEYMFAATGMILETVDRSIDHEWGASFMSDPLVVIGKKKDIVRAFPVHQLTWPFQTGAWIALLCNAFVFLLLGAAISVRFGVDFVEVLFGDRHVLQQRRADSSFIRISNLFHKALRTFFVIFLLLYEVSVTNYLFRRLEQRLDRNLNTLSSEDLKYYCALKDSAVESLWIQSSKFGKKSHGSRPRYSFEFV